MLLHVDTEPCHSRKIAHLVTQVSSFCAGTKVCCSPRDWLQKVIKTNVLEEKGWKKGGSRFWF